MVLAQPDRAIFEGLLRPLLDEVYRVACHLTGQASNAEDLVQEAALRAFRGFSSFQQGSNFRAWFYQILRNCHYAHHRQTRRQPATLELDGASDLHMFLASARNGLYGVCDDPVQLVMGKLTSEQVLDSLDRLPAEFRLVTRLYFVEEMRYEEIAEIIGCPVGTVRSRLHRGRKMLQTLLWDLAVATGIVTPVTPERSAPRSSTPRRSV